MKILVVVDMQNDFITGALGSPAAEAIVPNVVKRIEEDVDDVIYATRDTHDHEVYASTLEGQKLPVMHCDYGTPGWMIQEDVQAALDSLSDKVVVVNKITFGTPDVASDLEFRMGILGVSEEDLEIEVCGLVSSICVMANAIILRAAFPDAKIVVNKNLTAGLNEVNQAAAMEILASQQIDVIR